ncbi:MAG TPA: pyruvate dehydrogenase (acetyl-transferring), homodimeric type [Phycisphaerae bacterium]|nr:pyruvate dehydrogenase (acetyl-transferring), homodimeric type [Phycisphaerae bacterium]
MNMLERFDTDHAETQEWLESIEAVVAREGPQRAQYLMAALQNWCRSRGVNLPTHFNTPYVNTIHISDQPAYPGNREIERRLKSINRWNAMALVVRANRRYAGIGGHISTYASAATLLEVGYNHFFRANTHDHTGDQIYFQGHAAPGIYARSYLAGRITTQQMHNFRRELAPEGGLSSYPHPWLMKEFWEFPTVSMGLGPLSAIYQARFNHYLQDRGLADTRHCHVWAFLGDGEMDEPESMGAITLAAREKLDNLIFVVNCNLQRLDGPVRGNGSIVQELEAAFRGAGWNVIKVLWGDDWDPLFEADTRGLLPARMSEIVDGQWQKYTVESGEYIRENFFGTSPELLQLVEHLPDERLQKLRLGGHDPAKVYSAYKAAVDHEGQPTVILARTIKGYGLGEAGEGKNITHQQKKLNEEELRHFRDRFEIPISDRELRDAPFYRPPEGSPEMRYLHERRQLLGGYIPRRVVRAQPIQAPTDRAYEEYFKGSGGRAVSTTMAYVRILARLLEHKRIGKFIVPIVPDESRTFGMDALFQKYAIYAHGGQKYEPVDRNMLMYYREEQNGQVLQEGITEAGSMASFTAAGTAYVTHGINTIPFFTFYSMFGFQRIGDSIWACADMKGKGFLVGATAGRTTLAGEGLQHQDGHSQLLAAAVPNLLSYDPAFAYEIAVIIREGIRRMYELQDDIFYYITVANENYEHPPMPDGVVEGVLKGLYCFRKGDRKRNWPRIHLFGSGSILNEVLRAQQMLAERFKISADVWSVTSYQQLRRDALITERWNRLHPDAKPKKSYFAKLMEADPLPIVAASDYMKLVPEQIARWAPQGFTALGTDGFGRSEAREELRRFFEVDAESIVIAALNALPGRPDAKLINEALREFGIDPERPEPSRA